LLRVPRGAGRQAGLPVAAGIEPSVLGAGLLRRPDLRLSAALLAAPLPLIPLAILAEALAPGWGHPATHLA
jgi:hypothetical protein